MSTTSSGAAALCAGDEAQLLTMAVDRAIAGDAEPISLVDRPGVQAVLAAATGREKARPGAALGAPMLMRLSPLYRAFE